MTRNARTAAIVVAAVLALGLGRIAAAQDATITNARILTGAGEVIERGAIVIRGGRIASITAGAPAATVGAVVDAKGRTAMPGFIDAHRHLQLGDKTRAEMQSLLDAGFTTVLSGGGAPERQIAVRDQIERGEMPGPRLIPSGSFGLLANMTPEQAREGIRKLAALGVKYTGEVLLSPVPGPTEAELRNLAAMQDEGRKAGVAVQVHAVSTPAMMAAVRAKVDLLVHVPNKDWITPEEAAELAAAKTKILMAIGFGSPVFGVFADDNKPRFRDGKPWPEGIVDGVGGGKEAGYSMVNSRTLFDAGAIIGNGMDTTYDPQAGLAHELRSMNVVFSMRDSLKIMGPNTAAYLGMQDRLGALDAGKIADVLLFEGDPLAGYWNWLKPKLVMKEGRIVVDRR
jgi:imidazolonepropionase-like amidohydrolase